MASNDLYLALTHHPHLRLQVNYLVHNSKYIFYLMRKIWLPKLLFTHEFTETLTTFMIVSQIMSLFYSQKVNNKIKVIPLIELPMATPPSTIGLWTISQIIGWSYLPSSHPSRTKSSINFLVLLATLLGNLKDWKDATQQYAPKGRQSNSKGNSLPHLPLLVKQTPKAYNPPEVEEKRTLISFPIRIMSDKDMFLKSGYTETQSAAQNLTISHTSSTSIPYHLQRSTDSKIVR